MTAESALAHDCARHIAGAFADYNAEFRAITRRAPQRFDARDWKGSQHDAVERIELYDRWVDRAIAELSRLQAAIKDGQRDRITELLETARRKRAALVKYKIRKKELL